MRYFEDLTIGEGGEFGPYTITEAEIIEFGQHYDPQPFHVDPQAGAESIHGGLIASGLHSHGIMNRLIVEGWLGDVANLGSPGLEAMRLAHPVRPGDELRARLAVTELRPSRTRPDRGIVRFTMQLLNQRDELVVDTAAVIFVAKRS